MLELWEAKDVSKFCKRLRQDELFTRTRGMEVQGLESVLNDLAIAEAEKSATKTPAPSSSKDSGGSGTPGSSHDGGQHQQEEEAEAKEAKRRNEPVLVRLCRRFLRSVFVDETSGELVPEF